MSILRTMPCFGFNNNSAVGCWDVFGADSRRDDICISLVMTARGEQLFNGTKEATCWSDLFYLSLCLCYCAYHLTAFSSDSSRHWLAVLYVISLYGSLED